MIKWTKEKVSQAQTAYDSGLSMRQVGEKLGISVWSIRGLVRRHKFVSRKHSETNHLKFISSPLSFKSKTNLTTEEQLLKTAGLMLYWGEGAKKNSRSVDFSNSDPQMIKFFLTFLRVIYQPQESRFRILLYTYHSTNIKQQISYWSSLTNIPSTQFSKPYIRATSQQKHDKMPHGLIHIRYNDKRLFELIMSDLKVAQSWDDGVDKRASL